MKLQPSYFPLLLIGIALTAIIILSAGINDFEFLPGRPFKIGFEPEDTVDKEVAATGNYALTLFRILLFVYVASIPIAFFLISPRKRKRALLYLVLLFFLFAFLDRLMVNLSGFMRHALQLPTVTLPSLPVSDFGDPTLPFTPSPPQWFTVIVSTGVAILIVIAAIFLVRRIFNRRFSPADPLRSKIQDTLDELREGADLKDTVIRCYGEMGRVLMNTRGITRNKDMTPREFESSLRHAGLPQEPLYQLTRLFEEIRYGNKATGVKENRNAIKCLTAIIKACETEP